MDNLSAPQIRVYAYIQTFFTVNGYMPTRQEIADGIGRHPNAVHEVLQRLSKAGYIELIPRISRGIKIL